MTSVRLNILCGPWLNLYRKNKVLLQKEFHPIAQLSKQKLKSGLVRLNFHVYGFHPPFEEDLVRKPLERSIKTNLSIFTFRISFTLPSKAGQIGLATNAQWLRGVIHEMAICGLQENSSLKP